MYDILFIGKDSTEWQKFKSAYPNAQRLETVENWTHLKSKSFTKMFWVIWDDIEFNYSINLNEYSADKWDDMYVHIFKNDNTYNGVSLFPKNLNPGEREFKHKFFTQRKEVDIVLSHPKNKQDYFDVVFISYNEIDADQHYEMLKKKAPLAKRIHGVKGIHQAHIAAAKIVDTEMFYVVDGDAVIVDNYEFNKQISDYETDTVYVWQSKNPINDLTYGYGGVKLLPTRLTLDLDVNTPDMTTSISAKFVPVTEVSNISAFNTDEFSTWKSAFRECAKLASKSIERQENDETENRLDVWCSQGSERRYGRFAIQGACAGREYGLANSGNADDIKRINDFDWLKEQFDARQK